MMRFLDGTEVSHAGLYVRDQVAEVLVQEGLTQQPLHTNIANCDWLQVRRLTIVPTTMEPVLDVTQAPLAEKHRYVMEHILLLAGSA